MPRVNLHARCEGEDATMTNNRDLEDEDVANEDDLWKLESALADRINKI